jgi:hypothetical protein
MARVVVWAVVGAACAACRFHPGLAAPAEDAATGDATDAPLADAAEPDASPPPLCDPSDTTLRACYAFDGDTLDGSGRANHATASAPAFVPGRAGGQALVTSTGTITVESSTSLNMASLTIRMWIRPTTIPQNSARAGLLDSGGRYRLFLQSGGRLRCAMTNGTDLTTANAVIVADTWQRVTCTHDASTMRIYVDGVEVGSASGSNVPTGSGGMVIGHNSPSGDNFVGAIDDLQLFSTVITDP